ncbi:MAG: aconitase family protein [Bryobacteraceae bacterium]
MTLAEKILARASGRDEVYPGETVTVAVDLAASSGNADEVRKRFLFLGGEEVWDADRIVIVLEQLDPVRRGEEQKALRGFARDQELKDFYDIGRGGVCHQVVAEQGHALPGMFVVGTTRHAAAYGAYGALALDIDIERMAEVWKRGRLKVRVPPTVRIEVSGIFRPWISAKDLALHLASSMGRSNTGCCIGFSGPAIAAMSISSRMVLTSLARRVGAVSAFTDVDNALLTHLARMAGTPQAFSPAWAPDSDASYEKVLHINVQKELSEPQVACHGKAEKVLPLSEVADTKVDMAVLGSCSNGRPEDFAAAADVLTGKRVHTGTRLLAIPASQKVYLDTMKAGYLQALAAAGAVILPPGCGEATSIAHGMLVSGEVCISTTDCSYDSAAGSARRQVYEANPAVVAAAAAAGRIVHPEDVVEDTAA